MQRIAFLALLGALVSCSANPDDKTGPAKAGPKEAGGGGERWSFDADAVGAVPKGFSAEVGEWKVVEDETPSSKVLAQAAKSARPVFNVILMDEPRYADVEISVKMKSVAGEVDQGGGPVWRAKDAKNYYIARYNPLENNYRVYVVADGKRTQLQSADLKVSPGWHALRITMRGGKIECFLDDVKHLEAVDESFKDRGKAGLWTKADAQTYFDDLEVRELAPR
jgi:hypothetical protein